MKNLLLLLCFFCMTFNAFAQENCATALTLIPGTTQSGDSEGNTGDFPAGDIATPPINVCDGDFNADEYWFEFTPTIDGQTLTLTASNFTREGVGLFVFDNCPTDAPNCIGLNQNLNGFDDLVINTPDLIAGVTYKIVITSIAGFLLPDGTLSFTHTEFDLTSVLNPPIDRPDNNDCEDATVLIPEADLNCNNPVQGTTLDASQSLPGCTGTADDDVWYTFQATSTEHSIILNSLPGTNTIDIVTELFDACDGTSLLCQDSPNTPIDLTGLTVGNSYVFRIYTYSPNATSYMNFDICVGTPPPPPANDVCENAVNIPVNTDENCTMVTSGTLLSATNSGVSNCSGFEDDDVWFNFVATETAHVITISGTFYDINHAVYDGTCATLNTPIICSDPDSSFITGLTVGNTYLIQVYSATNTPLVQDPEFDICVSLPPPPPTNIDCINAAEISYGQFIATDNTFANGNSEGIGCDMGLNGLWFNFVGNGSLTRVVAAGADPDFVIEAAVASGSCGAFVNIGCDESFGGEDPGIAEIVFPTTLGESYSIYVAHYELNSTITGEFFVSLSSVNEFDNVWDGTDWTLGTPNTSQNLIINGNYDTTTDLSFQGASLVVNSGNTLLVNEDDFIDISGSILVNGTLNVAHTGSVVQQLETAQTFNNGAINVNITTPLLNARDFMLLGSPMSATNETVFNGAHQVLSHDTDVYTMYDDAPIAGINFYDDDGNDLMNFSGVLNPAEGYIVRPSMTIGDMYNYTYNEGTLNSGEIIYDAGFNVIKDDSANFLSNPYPSAIDANLFLLENSDIISEIYFWEHLTTPFTTPGPYGTQNFSMEDISTYNNMGGAAAANNGGTVPTNIISTGQGFGIKANEGGSVRFTNAMRVTSGNTTLRSQEDVNRLWLSVSEETNEKESSILVGFTDAATSGFDAGYDTEKIGTAVSLYTHLPDGTQNLSIQSREALETEMVIPMGFSSYFEEELSYTISISDFEGDQISNATIYLIDTLLGSSTNLKEAEYTFIATGGVYDNRFEIVLENEVLDANDLALSSISLYPNPSSNVVNIVSSTSGIVSIEVRDIRGRAVTTTSEINNTHASIDVSALKSAVYFVKITTGNEEIVTKRFLKE